MERTKKLRCSVTGNWSYCGEARYEKLVAQFGSEQKLLEGYQSRAGKKLVAAAEGDIAKAMKGVAATHKNKIACIVSGELMFISDARMTHLQTKLETDEQGVRDQYVSRVASRLRKEAAAQIVDDAGFSDLTKKDQKAIDTALRARYVAGDWPAPSAPKGSKQTTPAEPKAPKASKKAGTKPATTVVDTTPDTDPLRHIDGESSKDRKNRIRRERAAAAKL